MSQVATTNPAVEPVEAFTKLEQNGAATDAAPQGRLGPVLPSRDTRRLRDEDWRFTNVKPLAELPFRPASLRRVTQS